MATIYVAADTAFYKFGGYNSLGHLQIESSEGSSGLVDTQVHAPDLGDRAGNDNLYGGAGQDTLTAGSGNEALIGGAGNDLFNGGDGAADTAAFAGASSGYTFSRQSYGSVEVVTAGEGRDTISGVESLPFTDRVIANSSIALPFTSVRNNDFLSFGANRLFRNDDGNSGAIDISRIFENGIQIGGVTYSSIYVNNNGNITFGSGLSAFTPGVIGGNSSRDIIAPFWADVDTRIDVPGINDGVFWDFNTTRDSVIITWSDVGYYRERTDRLNSFQLELRDRGAGNIEIIFRYEDVEWTTGSASGGTGGLGGIVARAGFYLGGTYFELPASGSQSSILSLEDNNGNRGVSGVWQFMVQNGQLSGFGTEGNDTYIGTENADSYFGIGGNDSISGRGGNDALFGGAGNDTIFGGGGADVIDAGAGIDRLSGGNGTDTYIIDGQDRIIEGTNGGTDTARSSATYILASNVENLELTGTEAINGTGNGLNNRITGNSADNVLNGGTGQDSLIGGSGNDRYFTDGRDRITEAANGGTDTVNSSVNIILSANVEHLNLTGNSGVSGAGNGLNNRITGNGAENIIIGGAGNDTLNAGVGADKLTGGSGSDILNGGLDTNRDIFVFLFTSESRVGSSNRDVIQNFVSNIDDINLAGIDANTARSGDQSFIFSGTTARANSVWFEDIGADLLVSGDVNGDRLADFEIQVSELDVLVARDFIL